MYKWLLEVMIGYSFNIIKTARRQKYWFSQDGAVKNLNLSFGMPLELIWNFSQEK
jgi:hypothetical protein